MRTLVMLGLVGAAIVGLANTYAGGADSPT
jgi:hypothetical protein